MWIGGWVFKYIYLYRYIYILYIHIHQGWNTMESLTTQISPKVHTVPFMLYISSTPVVKYLVVIRAYLFKWWGNIKYHKFFTETGQWLSTDVCQLGKVHLSVWVYACVCVVVWTVTEEHENGEVVSSWSRLKVMRIEKKGWINRLESLARRVAAVRRLMWPVVGSV